MSNLIEVCRTWVQDKNGKQAEHLLKTEVWLRRIAPDATEAMLLAALTHDMERAFPGPDSPHQDPNSRPDDPQYIQEHSERSARIVSDFLREQQASEELIAEVARLIRVHEIGGWHEADLIQAADSLSFLEVNVDIFLSFINASKGGWSSESVRAKFDWMYERIKIPEARILATPLYEQALLKLRQKVENSPE